MPVRRVSKPARRNGAVEFPQQRIADLVLERERLLAELSEIEARGDSSKQAQDALQLVTRWWGTATWHGREKLLRSAQWLLTLKRRSEEPQPARLERARSRT
jgi:hypothetical protein